MEYQSSQLLRISDGREFELQSSSENSKPCTEQGQNIRYHHCEKFKMSQVTHFLNGPCLIISYIQKIKKINKIEKKINKKEKNKKK